MTDLMRRVREFDANPPSPTADARLAAHARLQDAIDREREGSRRVSRSGSGALSRRLMFRVAIGATAATALAATTVVVSEHGGLHRDDTPRMLSAAQVLQKAASRSRTQDSDPPIPRNDQYFYTRTFITQTPVAGGKTKTWTDESWLSVDGSKPSQREEHGKIHHDPPLGKHQVTYPPTVYAKLKKWPTDPDELLKWLRLGDTKSTPESDRMAFFQASLLMMGPRVMPPGLQAAAFEAVGKIPGVKVDHDQFDALGRPGVAISYPKTEWMFVFDRKTYDYLGLRTRGTRPKRVNGEWKQVDPYYEMRSLEKTAVVDRIGQRP